MLVLLVAVVPTQLSYKVKKNQTDRAARQTQAGIGHSAPTTRAYSPKGNGWGQPGTGMAFVCQAASSVMLNLMQA